MRLLTRPQSTFTRQPALWMGLSVLGVVLLVGSGFALRFGTAHAASIGVTDCSQYGHSGDGGGTLFDALASVSTGDTIAFTCSGTITVPATIVVSNTLTFDASGHSVALSGGGSVGVFNVAGTGNLTLKSLTVEHGYSTPGGGAVFNNAKLSVISSTFSSNSSGAGGAILNYNSGTATITNSTFSSNASGGNGGAIYNVSGTMSIADSTFSGNSASGFGGAIFNQASLDVTSSTFAGNSAPGNPPAPAPGGGAFYNMYYLTITNSIVAESSAGGNCSSEGVITDGGYNLEDGTSCGFSSAHHSLSSTNPLLGSLANNGGPTQTMALLAGSPALDVIPTSAGCGTSALAADQRGIARPQGSGCDIGAYERAPGSTTHLTANPTSIVQGSSVQLCATVAAVVSGTGIPAGTVTFKDGSATLKTGTLSGGKVCISTTSLSLGTHSITASYGGDSQFSASVSAPATVTVGVYGEDVAGSPAGSGSSGAPSSGNSGNTGATGNGSEDSGASASGQQSQGTASSGSRTLASSSTASTQPAGSSSGWPAGLGVGLGVLLLLIGMGGLGTVLVRAARR